MTQFFAILGAFSSLCMLISRVLPAGKAQAAFAFLGHFSTVKPLDAKPEEPKQ
jgi:hypothetical protein